MTLLTPVLGGGLLWAGIGVTFLPVLRSTGILLHGTIFGIFLPGHGGDL